MEHMEVSAILDEMEKLYPDAHCELNHRNAYEMAVAVILSAQTTDASVNKVTPELFTKYPTIDSLAEGDLKEIEQYISSLGLYHNKAKSIQGFAKGVVENYHGVGEVVVAAGDCFFPAEPDSGRIDWRFSHHPFIFLCTFRNAVLQSRVAPVGRSCLAEGLIVTLQNLQIVVDVTIYVAVHQRRHHICSL